MQSYHVYLGKATAAKRVAYSDLSVHVELGTATAAPQNNVVLAYQCMWGYRVYLGIRLQQPQEQRYPVLPVHAEQQILPTVGSIQGDGRKFLGHFRRHCGSQISLESFKQGPV